MDGEPRLACPVLTLECGGIAIETIEGMTTTDGPHPLQTAFAELNTAQCGYCTPGFLMIAKALLDSDRAPSRETMKDELAGNLRKYGGRHLSSMTVDSAPGPFSREC